MLKRTPFYGIHQKSGAKLIDFGGFEMPVQYEGIIREHKAVRERAGIFDVSHMGEIFVRGPRALELVQFATVNDASKLTPGKAQYSAMCYENGGIVDDLLVYCLAEDNFLLVVNASNKDKDFEWLSRLNATFGAEIEDASDNYCLLAVQGPDAPSALQKLTGADLSDIPYYTFRMSDFAGFPDVLLSATGYTGEKGFEIYFDRRQADPESVWYAIMDAGAEFGLQPCGLGARDTLRLEKGFALYGNDITSDTTPLEAGLAWITKFDKGDFCGREALLRQKETGISRKLIGFITEDKRAIPRSQYTLLNVQGNTIGAVSSGGKSIMLDKGIGMGYVETGYSVPGTEIQIAIRDNIFAATVVRPPFYTKAQG